MNATQTNNWIGGWNDTPGNVRVLARDLRAAGVQAKTGRSIYDDHRELLVAADDVYLAKKVLCELGCDFEARALGA